MPEEEKVYTSMYSRNAELYHHGILGQKWGVQNGPPYPLDSKISTGKRLRDAFSRKVESEEVRAKRLEEKAQARTTKDYKKAEKEANKESRRDTVTSKAVRKAKSMTDDELKKAVARLNFEKQYANLEKELAELNKKNPTLMQKVKNGIKNEAKKQLKKTGDTVLNSITSEINKQISAKVKDAMKDVATPKKKAGET